MAAPALRRGAWLAASVAAAGIIAVLAVQGQRPDPGLARFVAAGLMPEPRPERVTVVEVETGARRWRFERDAAGDWHAARGSERPAARFAGRLDEGLRFLHVSAPLRRLSADEIRQTPLGDFGLDPPRYVVTVRGDDGPPLRMAFGAANPQGLGQYVRVVGRDEVTILPRFVGESWETAVGVR